MKFPSKEQYGEYLAEFQWRNTYLGSASDVPPRQWQRTSFWRLAATFADLVSADDLRAEATWHLASGEERFHGFFPRRAALFAKLLPEDMPNPLQLPEESQDAESLPLSDAEVEELRRTARMLYAPDALLDAAFPPQPPMPMPQATQPAEPAEPEPAEPAADPEAEFVEEDDEDEVPLCVCLSCEV